ncbi:hypothetical protein [Gilliamella sp. Pas-s95]|uniref:hypothetical protein n=1 Tax=Gilliamella sp. Pas-s95 TaxID=2687317 RepID=UPI00132BC899|nr:hypothetical protein [Gilliamella sp. Pas-s95]MWN05356.1 hypothetical protein [Gilliamella sp. Pas-s95]
MCRQQSEVSTPNRDVWRVCGASGTRPQTVRQDRAAAEGSRRPHSAALRGVFRGFRKKIP